MRATKDSRPELVNNLLLSGASAVAKNKKGSRPLHVAVQEGHLGVVKLLLKAGASPSSRRKVRGGGVVRCEAGSLVLFVIGWMDERGQSERKEGMETAPFLPLLRRQRWPRKRLRWDFSFRRGNVRSTAGFCRPLLVHSVLHPALHHTHVHRGEHATVVLLSRDACMTVRHSEGCVP